MCSVTCLGTACSKQTRSCAARRPALTTASTLAQTCYTYIAFQPGRHPSGELRAARRRRPLKTARAACCALRVLTLHAIPFCLNTHTHIHTHVYIHIYIYMYVYIYVYILRLSPTSTAHSMGDGKVMLTSTHPNDRDICSNVDEEAGDTMKNTSTSNSTGNDPVYNAPDRGPEYYNTDTDNDDSDDYLMANPNDALNRITTRNNVTDNEINTINSGANQDNEYYKDKDTSNDNDNSDGTTSPPSLMRKKTRLLSPRLANQRKTILKTFIKNNLCLMAFCWTVYVLFWGSVYDTNKYLYRVKILCVIQDDYVDDLPITVTPLTDSIPSFIQRSKGTWHLYDTANFTSKYHRLDTTERINEKVIDLVYDETFWIAINFKPNMTRTIFNSITNQSAPPFNSTNLVQYVYESGRDLGHVRPYMVPIITKYQEMFSEFYTATYLPELTSNITNEMGADQVNYANLGSAGKMVFDALDYRPFYDRILLTCTQIGAVFAGLLTVFQFLVFGEVHAEVAPLLKHRYRIYYRIGISFVTHFFASLFWCTVTAVYQVDFTRAFGRGGFMVYWMSTWLYMWAMGSANENVISLIFAASPQYLGFWILGFILTNLGPTFFPPVLNNAVYRYGYIMPMRNIVDIYRIIFMDVSKWKMGRCYAVLAGWVILNLSLLPLSMKLTKMIVKYKARKAKQAADAQ